MIRTLPLLLLLAVVGAGESAAGKTWYFTYCKYVNGAIAFRDPADRLWPTHVWAPRMDDGSVSGGTLVWDPRQPRLSCWVRCDRWNQDTAGPALFTLGELIPAAAGTEPPPVGFRLTGIGALQRELDDRKRERTWAEGTGELSVGDRRIAVRPRVTFTWWDTMGRMDATMRIRGAELGLQRMPGEMDVTVSMEFRDQEMERGPDGHTRPKPSGTRPASGPETAPQR